MNHWVFHCCCFFFINWQCFCCYTACLIRIDISPLIFFKYIIALLSFLRDTNIKTFVLCTQINSKNFYFWLDLKKKNKKKISLILNLFNKTIVCIFIFFSFVIGINSFQVQFQLQFYCILNLMGLLLFCVFKRWFWPVIFFQYVCVSFVHVLKCISSLKIKFVFEVKRFDIRRSHFHSIYYFINIAGYCVMYIELFSSNWK